MTHQVLIVDDAPELRTLLVLALGRDERFETVGDVGNGKLGVKAVDEHHPDVVLMDVAMPVMDGLEATRQIKAAHPRLPVVIFTGDLLDAR